MGDALRFTAGWTARRLKDGRKPIPAQRSFEIPVPRNSNLHVDHVYYKREVPTGSHSNVVRMTKDYQILWQGRVVKNGATHLTLVYIGRLAEETDGEQSFVLPGQLPGIDMSRDAVDRLAQQKVSAKCNLPTVL